MLMVMVMVVILVRRKIGVITIRIMMIVTKVHDHSNSHSTHICHNSNFIVVAATQACAKTRGKARCRSLPRSLTWKPTRIQHKQGQLRTFEKARCLVCVREGASVLSMSC